MAFLDADDRWTPEFLARQVAYLERNRGCALVYCDALISGETPLAGRRFMETAPSNGDVTLVSLIRQDCNIALSRGRAEPPSWRPGVRGDAGRGQDFQCGCGCAQGRDFAISGFDRRAPCAGIGAFRRRGRRIGRALK